MSAHLSIKMVQAGGHTFPIDVDLTATILELKEQIATQAGVPKENIRLVCTGKIWQDVATVGSYEPREGAIVHCLNNPPKAAPAAAEQTLQPVHPMAGMMQAAPAPAAANSNDPFAQMVAQSQQMMSQNPEMMTQLMDSPMVQQMMSNPETMRAMMRMNPRMNELMEQRPELARMLEDPELMQQSMRMMRNPSLMREAQRNSDLAMGHLDVMPGGHNALARAHQDMVDPLMAALSGSGENGAGAVDLAAYAQQSAGPAPNSEALPNPWGAPAPAPAQAAPVASQAPAGGYGGMPGNAAANPMAAMMQGMNAQPNAATGGEATNPMAAMMQQMMSNPAMMQQSMQMMQGMNGGMGGMGAMNNAAATPGVPAAPVQPNPMQPNPFAAMMGGMQQPGVAPQAGGQQANPMAAMMQQMMANPAMMQGMMGGGGGAGGFPGDGMFGAQDYQEEPEEEVELDPAAARLQFASQLAQLSAMGFTNEAACLRALQRHHGRVDSAIDALLSSGDGM